jgi:hypothetical protein
LEEPEVELQEVFLLTLVEEEVAVELQDIIVH